MGAIWYKTKCHLKGTTTDCGFISAVIDSMCANEMIWPTVHFSLAFSSYSKTKNNLYIYHLLYSEIRLAAISGIFRKEGTNDRTN